MWSVRLAVTVILLGPTLAQYEDYYYQTDDSGLGNSTGLDLDYQTNSLLQQQENNQLLTEPTGFANQRTAPLANLGEDLNSLTENPGLLSAGEVDQNLPDPISSSINSFELPEQQQLFNPEDQPMLFQPEADPSQFVFDPQVFAANGQPGELFNPENQQTGFTGNEQVPELFNPGDQPLVFNTGNEQVQELFTPVEQAQVFTGIEQAPELLAPEDPPAVMTEGERSEAESEPSGGFIEEVFNPDDNSGPPRSDFQQGQNFQVNSPDTVGQVIDSLPDIPTGDLCHLENRLSNIVLDISESQGNLFDQMTFPRELPVMGNPSVDIELELLGSDMFRLEGKSLKLTRALDRDRGDISSLVFQVTCTVITTGKRRTIPVILRISDINDNVPMFVRTPYTVTLPESTPVNSVVYRDLKAEDGDTGENGQVEYRVVPGDESVTDGYGVFTINLPHQGIVSLIKSLDYEETAVYYVNIQATDRAVDSQKLTSTTTLKVIVQDSDDLGPGFSYRTYTSTVVRGPRPGGVLNIKPDKIQAADRDTLRAEIVYSFVGGSPEYYPEYFTLDTRTGVVRQVKPIGVDDKVEKFELVVKAQERTELRRSETAQLIVSVEDEDNFPPELSVSANEGFVSENVPPGTLILDKDGNHITFKILDKDKPGKISMEDYDFEFTSGQFGKNSENQLVVGNGLIDRDPPSQPVLLVQVVARESSAAGKASAPVSIRIAVSDVNDNPPLLPSFSPFTIAAGNTRRLVTNLNATDIDGDDVIKYKITHVTNRGKRKFYVNPNTGDLEVIGEVKAGEEYKIKVTAKDLNEASSQSVVEVRVSAGPNIRPPVFHNLEYEAEVSEGSPRHTTVVGVAATDPEGGGVTYSIVSGDTENDFTIGESTGVIRVDKPLDRETNKLYTLTIRAADEDGRGSTATVTITVADVNDESPEFVNIPYSFRVKEGVAEAYVGTVTATDRDSPGPNSNITYTIQEDTAFSIQPYSGKISTKTELDFEASQVHYVVVQAQDTGSRLGTATATILVQDVSDEFPIFSQPQYNATVPENIKGFPVVTVSATDKDTVSQITYRIVEGELDKFQIDPATGEVSTVKELDFESSREHKLIIGTEEARLSGGEFNSTTTQLIVTVSDANDMAPEFISVPPGQTVYVRNDVVAGSVVGRVSARDGDGSEPNNLVSYWLEAGQSTNRAEQYFRIDAETGEIKLQGDLTNELYDEYRLAIVARDKGESSLETSLAINILVEQVVTLPPNTGVGFSQLQYQIQVMENTPQEALLKTLTLSDKPEKKIRLGCSVTRVVDKAGEPTDTIFKAVLNSAEDCDLILATAVLDYEEMDSYLIDVSLHTLSAFVNEKRKIAQVNVTIQDKNDNAPQFVYEEPYSKMLPNKYLSVVKPYTPEGELVGKVRVTDRDSGTRGEVHFEITADTDPIATKYFNIEMNTGNVYTSRSMENLSPDINTPFRLFITARDNPGHPEDSKMDKTEMVVNVVQANNIMVLAVRGSRPEDLAGRGGELEAILEDQTGLVVTVDQTAPLVAQDENGTCCTTDIQGSDIWFYAVDPTTQEILVFNDSLSYSKILEKSAATNLKYIVTGDLQIQASELHELYLPPPGTTIGPTTSSLQPFTQNGFSGYPSFLIAVGCIIFAFSFAAIIYLAFLYTRYQNSREKCERMVVIPRYEPVFVEPNLKEYETQVLQMSVNIDDVDSADLKLDFNNRSHGIDPGFNLDSVSYITHHTTSTEGSPVGDSDLTGPPSYRAATVHARGGRPLARTISNRRSEIDSGLVNPAYNPGETAQVFGRSQEFNTSTPKQRTHSFKSPIDATTQL